jgi:hypothetical protein
MSANAGSIRPEAALVSALSAALPAWNWWPTRTGHVHGARASESEDIAPAFTSARWVGWRWRGREWGLGEMVGMVAEIRNEIGREGE